jgi:hypothetical protein
MDHLLKSPRVTKARRFLVFAGIVLMLAAAVATTRSFIGSIQTAKAADTVRVGQLVYTTNKTVYYVGSTGLYGFPNAPTFYSWGYTFSQVVPANSAEAALSMVGIVPTKQTGCSDPVIQLSGSCGYSPTTSIRLGQVIFKSDQTIYLVGPSGLYGFTDAPTFYSWGFKFSDVLPANSSESSLTMVGTVPVKLASCSTVLNQIVGSCGSSASVTGSCGINQNCAPVLTGVEVNAGNNMLTIKGYPFNISGNSTVSIVLLTDSSGNTVTLSSTFNIVSSSQMQVLLPPGPAGRILSVRVQNGPSLPSNKSNVIAVTIPGATGPITGLYLSPQATLDSFPTYVGTQVGLYLSMITNDGRVPSQPAWDDGTTINGVLVTSSNSGVAKPGGLSWTSLVNGGKSGMFSFLGVSSGKATFIFHPVFNGSDTSQDQARTVTVVAAPASTANNGSTLICPSGYTLSADGQICVPSGSTTTGGTCDPLQNPSCLPACIGSGTGYACVYDSALNPVPYSGAVGPGWYIRFENGSAISGSAAPQYALNGSYQRGYNFQPYSSSLYRIDGSHLIIKIPPANSQDSMGFQQIYNGQIGNALNLRLLDTVTGGEPWDQGFMVAQPNTRIYDGGGGYVGNVSSDGVFSK